VSDRKIRAAGWAGSLATFAAGSRPCRYYRLPTQSPCRTLPERSTGR